MTDPILTAGQWEALLFQCPDQVKPLLMRLAIHHGAMEPPRPEHCPLCNAKDEQGRMGSRPEGR